jgi:ribonuclease G
VSAAAPVEGKPKPRAAPRSRKPEARRPESRRKQPTRRAPLPKARRELLVSVSVTEQRVAVLEDDRVAEVYLERPDRRSIAGNVYKGVVDNVLPGMEAAFVEIGLEKNGFLYVDEIVGPELEGKGQGRRIQNLLSRGQELLVQAVKDPMKTKGARLTTEISLPGRFVVYVPQGEGIGVSRRLDEDERTRLRDVLKNLELPKGGVIVRTAAEGASPEDIERDVVFLQKLWKQIQTRAKEGSAPALVYQEAELPLRVVRDLFTEDFERAFVDDDLTLKRVSGYLKKTSPHMAERLSRYRDKAPLFEAFGVDAEIRSTLRRRVDLPSGGYLVFDYAEAFTVVDVNTGRFVGSRSKTSTARLEDTITKNNLEAVTEVVHQLRLRDIGGIIVIDFIDMANPRNRELVEEALKRELERDRTKTYVVEISPLGLVEMTRQNVTEGPREILTKRCPTCDGDGIVISEASAAVEAESRLRALASQSPRTRAFRVELSSRVASLLIGPGAQNLMAIEEGTRRRFFLDARDDVPHDHFAVLAKGPIEKVAPEGPLAEGEERVVKLVEVGLHDPSVGVAKIDEYEISVSGAASLVGKRVKVRVERVLGGMAYASLVRDRAEVPAPITAEDLAERPTRQQRPKASTRQAPAEPEAEPEAGEVDAALVEGAPADGDEEAPKKRKTRRGSRGGRRRRKTPAVVPAEAAELPVNGPIEPVEVSVAIPRIHLPEVTLGREPEQTDNGTGEEAATDAATEAPKRKRTRRGSRGGRGRRKKAAAVVEAAAESDP